MARRGTLAGVATLLMSLVAVPSRAGGDQQAEPLSPRVSSIVQKPGQPVPQNAADLQQIRLVYANALQVLAAGSREAALATVVTLERSACGRAGNQDTRRLELAESTLARRLGERDCESLVPVMLLHHDLVAEYRRLGEFVLSETTGRLALSLAELYGAESANSQARSLAGGLVASLAGQAQNHGEILGAKTLFERAVALDPTCEPALLGLGALWEVLGRYDMAVASLGRLRTEHPTNWRGTLRLGVNLVRIGRHGPGIAALRSCLDEAAPEWVAVIASEELARVLLAQGKLDEAAAVLTQAADRFPNQAGVLVELALVLDRRHASFEVRRAFARLEDMPVALDPSPRLRYSQRPHEEIEAAREHLAQASTSRLTALAGALERLEPATE